MASWPPGCCCGASDAPAYRVRRCRSVTTLENILGYQLPVPEYKHYFDDFIIAQQHRLGRTSQDAIKRQMNWARLFTAFSYTPLARSIPEVQEYKRQLQLATLL
jgi:hypothetical protein